MSKKLILVLAHQDDEFCIFNRISKFQNKKNIYVFYLTSGLNKNCNKFNKSHRDIESLKVLKKLGVLEKKVFFLGRELSINHNSLYKNLDTAFQNLLKILKKIKGSKTVITHSLEGGHEDHDSCYYLVSALNKKFKLFTNSFQFPAYHGKNLPYIFYKVFDPIVENGKILKEKINFFDKFKFIYLLFIYKSQLKTWLGLYPFIIYKYLFKNRDSLQKINANVLFRKPHRGKLFYEKRKFCSYQSFRFHILSFLTKNKIK